MIVMIMIMIIMTVGTILHAYRYFITCMHNHQYSRRRNNTTRRWQQYTIAYTTQIGAKGRNVDWGCLGAIFSLAWLLIVIVIVIVIVLMGVPKGGTKNGKKPVQKKDVWVGLEPRDLGKREKEEKGTVVTKPIQNALLEVLYIQYIYTEVFHHFQHIVQRSRSIRTVGTPTVGQNHTHNIHTTTNHTTHNSHYITSHNITSHHIISHQTPPLHFTSHHTTPYSTTSNQTPPHHIKSDSTTSHHTTLHHTTPLHSTSHSTTPLHMITNQAVITSVQPSPSPVHQAPSSTQQHPACHSIPSSYGWSCLFIPPSCTIPCCHFIMASWGEQLAYQSNHHWLEQSPKNKKQKTKMLLSVESYQEKTKTKTKNSTVCDKTKNKKQKPKTMNNSSTSTTASSMMESQHMLWYMTTTHTKENKYQY